MVRSSDCGVHSNIVHTSLQDTLNEGIQLFFLNAVCYSFRLGLTSTSRVLGLLKLGALL